VLGRHPPLKGKAIAYRFVARSCRKMRSRVQKIGVVPAKAGTHNHKKQLLRQAGVASVPDDYGLWLWVPDQRSLGSLVRDDGVLLFRHLR